MKPTEEEISLLLKAAGRHKQNSVDASEIEYALNLWHSYVTNRAKIQSIFEMYDTDHSEKLEFDKLVLYLTDLNEGHRPKVTTKTYLHYVRFVDFMPPPAAAAAATPLTTISFDLWLCRMLKSRT